MIKKTITFADLEGNMLTEDFFFHIAKHELAKLKMSNEDIEQHITNVVASKDGEKIMAFFEDIIRKSIGVKHPDGVQFIKTKELQDRFMNSNAYDVFFMELVTDAKMGAEFVNGVMPADIAKKVADTAGLESPVLAAVEANLDEGQTATKKFPYGYTEAELLTMDDELFDIQVNSLPGNNIPRVLIQVMMKRNRK